MEPGASQKWATLLNQAVEMEDQVIHFLADAQRGGGRGPRCPYDGRRIAVDAPSSGLKVEGAALMSVQDEAFVEGPLVGAAAGEKVVALENAASGYLFAPGLSGDELALVNDLRFRKRKRRPLDGIRVVGHAHEEVLLVGTQGLGARDEPALPTPCGSESFDVRDFLAVVAGGKRSAQHRGPVFLDVVIKGVSFSHMIQNVVITGEFITTFLET